RAADVAICFGLVGATGAAVTGLTDWSETYGGPKRVGLLHGLLNVTATTLFTASWAMRRRGDSGRLARVSRSHRRRSRGSNRNARLLARVAERGSARRRQEGRRRRTERGARGPAARHGMRAGGALQSSWRTALRRHPQGRQHRLSVARLGVRARRRIRDQRAGDDAAAKL